MRLGGVDCAASYLHEPGDPRDGITVTVPLYVLNQVSEERCEWLVPGMLKDKVQALVKSLPRGRVRDSCRIPNRPCVWPRRCRVRSLGSGTLTDALLKQVREATSLGRQARGLQAGHGAAAPVHELPRRGRTRAAAGHGAQPRAR